MRSWRSWCSCFVLTIAPLTVFARSLTRAKRRGIIEYGALAARYANEFHDKWIVPEADPKEPLVGSADIQSLADMAGSYEIVQTMRSVPITAQMIVGFAAATLLPVASAAAYPDAALRDPEKSGRNLVLADAAERGFTGGGSLLCWKLASCRSCVLRQL